MKKYLFSGAYLFIVLFLFSSCRMNVLTGEGNKSVKSPVLSAFDAVDIDVSLKAVINVVEGAQPGIQLNSYDNILKHIKTTVENNKLKIYSDLDETWKIEDKDLSVVITLPSLTALALNGSPDADVHGKIAGKELKVAISGASTIKMDSVNVDDFSIEVSGAGDVVVNGGYVKHAEYEINGAGDLKAFKLKTDETVASISGAGNSEVTALQKLTAEINGAGSIKYKGHPVVTQDVSGVGSVSDAN